MASVTEVGKGDLVKVNGQWLEIDSNTASGEVRTPRSWTVRAASRDFGMFDIEAYAKKDELKR